MLQVDSDSIKLVVTLTFLSRWRLFQSKAWELRQVYLLELYCSRVLVNLDRLVVLVRNLQLTLSSSILVENYEPNRGIVKHVLYKSYRDSHNVSVFPLLVNTALGEVYFLLVVGVACFHGSNIVDSKMLDKELSSSLALDHTLIRLLEGLFPKFHEHIRDLLSTL